MLKRCKENIKYPYLVKLPICEVTILILEWANVISALLFADVFKNPLFIIPHNSGKLQLQLSFGCKNFLPAEQQGRCSCHITQPSPAGHTPSFSALSAKEDPFSAKPAFCLVCLTFSILELPLPVLLGGDA